MTAIVGILNKHGVAIAADSATTVSNSQGRKVLNSATKIFQLSKKYPVAVMIYSNASFLDTPWELIIKLYCQRRGNKPKHHLKDWAKDFIDFLGDEDYFCNKEMQKASLHNHLIDYYKAAYNNSKEKYEAYLEDEDVVEKPTHEELFAQELKESEEYLKEQEKCPELEDYSFKSFRSYAEEGIDFIMENGIKDEGFSESLREQFEHSAYEFLRSHVMLDMTGIVFVGFGEDAIFPSVYPINISGAFDNRLRYSIDKNKADDIGNECTSLISPFAQTDVMLTFIDGISPELREKVTEAQQDSIDMAHQMIYRQLEEAGVSDEVLSIVANTDLEKVKEEYISGMREHLLETRSKGLFNAVESFNVEELANMAENLVSITNLQRHITSSEETVGGPVDVAVITRCEGFIWVKRKMWFDSQLNRHVVTEEK